MRQTLFATAVISLLAAGAYAQVSPTVGLYNRDNKGVAAPVPPTEDFINKAAIPSSGTVTLTCPAGTGQYYTAAAAGADYEVRRNGHGAACPSSSTTGTAGAPRPGPRGWVASTTDLTFCGTAGVVVYVGCWSFK